MNNEQLTHLYDQYKEQLKSAGKEALIDENNIEKYIQFGDALSTLMETNNLSVNTLNGGPKYDSEKDALIVSLSKNDNTEEIGNISLRYNGINISYIDRNDISEAYSNLSFDGENLTGNMSKIIDDSHFVTAELGDKTYSIGDETYPYATENEKEKITEINNALLQATYNMEKTHQL